MFARARQLWVVLIVCGALGARAGAQDAVDPRVASRRAFEAGQAAYEHGQFAEALAHFERAYTLQPSADLLYTVARTADSDGRPARAIEAYSTYLEAVPDAPNRDFVEARIEKMRALERDQAAPLPTVAQAERAVPTPQPAPDARADRPTRPAWKRAWFWSAVGAVVVGGVIASVVLASRDREPARADADVYVTIPEAR